MKKILFIISMVVLLAVGCNSSSKSQLITQTTQQQARQNPTSTPNQVQNTNLYANNKYGFQLNLTNAWKGVKITEGNDSSGYKVQFSVPTVDPGTKKQIPDFVLLTIAVWPKSVWDNYNSDNTRPKPEIKLIIEKNNQVFVWTSFEGLDPQVRDYFQKIRPRDNSGKIIDFEIPKVVSSFKFK